MTNITKGLSSLFLSLTVTSCTSTGEFDLGKAIASTAALGGAAVMSDVSPDAAASFAANTLTQINSDGQETAEVSPVVVPEVAEVNARAVNASERKTYSPAGATKSNLIDQYGLARFRNASDEDHIVYYIKTADVYYKSYKETGNPEHYDAHKKTADIARQFNR